MSRSTSSVTKTPCSIWSHPAMIDARMLSGLWACTAVRSPCALASPHAARSCASVIVLRGADALHCREPRHQHGVGVPRGGERLLRWGLAVLAGVESPARVE